jgi:hypothetical protein
MNRCSCRLMTSEHHLWSRSKIACLRARLCSCPSTHKPGAFPAAGCSGSAVSAAQTCTLLPVPMMNSLVSDTHSYDSLGVLRGQRVVPWIWRGGRSKSPGQGRQRPITTPSHQGDDICGQDIHKRRAATVSREDLG